MLNHRVCLKFQNLKFHEYSFTSKLKAGRIFEWHHAICVSAVINVYTDALYGKKHRSFERRSRAQWQAPRPDHLEGLVPCLRLWVWVP